MTRFAFHALIVLFLSTSLQAGVQSNNSTPPAPLPVVPPTPLPSIPESVEVPPEAPPPPEEREEVSAKQQVKAVRSPASQEKEEIPLVSSGERVHDYLQNISVTVIGADSSSGSGTMVERGGRT